MTPARRNNTSPIDVEAQGDPEEQWRNAARKIYERIVALGPESPEGRAYDQLEALMGEGWLMDVLQRMLRQVRTAEGLLAADKNRKREKEAAINKLRSLTSLLKRRQRRAMADARVNAFMDGTFPLGLIRELPDAIAYFEGDNKRPSARKVIGLGGHSGGGVNKRSKLSIKHAVIGRCAEEIRIATEKLQIATSENCDEAVGILAAMMFGLKDATPSNVERWRKQWVLAGLGVGDESRDKV